MLSQSCRPFANIKPILVSCLIVNIGIWTVSEWLNINLRSLMQNLVNIAIEESFALLFIEWLQGFFIVYSTIGTTARFRPLNSLEHCIITSPITNIQGGPDSNPVYTSEFRARTGPNDSSRLAIITCGVYIFLKYRPTLGPNWHFVLVAGKLIMLFRIHRFLSTK